MRKLARKKAHREHILRNLVTSLVLYEKIVTTAPRAKDARMFFDRLVAKIKNKDEVNGRRILKSFLFDRNAVKKIYDVLLKRFEKRNSGYTKIYNLGPRVGDNAPMVILEIIDRKKEPAETKKQPEIEKEDKEINEESKAKKKVKKGLK